jgi:hypothetical protein
MEAIAKYFSEFASILRVIGKRESKMTPNESLMQMAYNHYWYK